MWAIENNTRFAAERSFVRDQDGAEIFLVAVRATFDFDSTGRVRISKDQQPVAETPEYIGKTGFSSLRWDTDLVRTKVGTDVLVNGSAYAPNGNPVEHVETSIRVGPIHKKVSVVGDRILEGRLFSQPKPFHRVPITYERAYGNPNHAENPIGTDGRHDREEGSRTLPNVIGTSEGVSTGYGAINCSWQPRLDFAGTHDKTWEQTRKPLVPKDFDDRHFSTAPSDQQVGGFLKGGEKVELVNLTPNGRVSFQLPRITFGFTTFIDNSRIHHRANLHSVILEPDQQKFMMVWHSSLPCHHTLYTLKKCVVFEKAVVGKNREMAVR